MSYPTILAALFVVSCGGGASGPAKHNKAQASFKECKCTVLEKFKQDKNQTQRSLSFKRGDAATFVFTYLTEGTPDSNGKRIGDLMLILFNEHAGPDYKSGKGKGVGLTLWANDKSHETVARWMPGGKKPGKVTDAYVMNVPPAFEAELRRAGWISFQLKGSEPWKTPKAFVGEALRFFEAMPAK